MVKQTLIAFLIIPVYGFLTPSFGQKAVTIKLDNPSFEDYPAANQTPDRWKNCGFDGESPPDTQPSGSFGVTKKAFDGDTYLGLVVRDNDTWEAVGQKLKTPLLKDSTYSFSVYLCRSKTYMSMSKTYGKDANYTTPAVIKIWGGAKACGRDELLAESIEIKNDSWQKFDFVLKPQADYSYFYIEAYYKNELYPRYNGNVLVDKASDIVPIVDKN
jgi:hypothetical protein